MLKEYLQTAKEDLEAKKEILDIKQQRLTIAQDEFHLLKHAYTGLDASRTSREFVSLLYSFVFVMVAHVPHVASRRVISSPSCSCLSSLLSPFSFPVNSTSSSSSTKFDPDLLKADVALAKNRVARLRRDLEVARAEFAYQQRGIDMLSQ